MAKYLRLVLVGCLVGFGVSYFTKMIAANPVSCSAPYRQDISIRTDSNTLNAEVVKTEGDRQQGLSGRKCIGQDQAMLFVFDKPGIYDFWMKDMKFPIDIIWLNQNKTVNHVEYNVTPATYPKSFANKNPAKFVLELQSGRAKTLNITEGTNLQFNL